MSLIINGSPVEVFGLDSVDFRDRRYHLARSGYHDRPKGVWIRGIVLHTRMGLPAKTVMATGANRRWDELVAGRWARSGRMAGAHIAIDADGSYSCMCDLAKHSAHHAGHVNDHTIGIEIYQSADGTLYWPAIEAAVKIVDVVTREFGIQRQIPSEIGPSWRLMRGGKRPIRKSRRLAWTKDGRSGLDFCGVYGHRNITRNRGKGDPGDEVIVELVRLGYGVFSIDEEEDLIVWKRRQYMVDAISDGIPGPKTAEALTSNGFLRGQYVYRLSDSE